MCVRRCRYIPEQHGGPAAKHAKARELLYGCQDGRLVQLLVDAGTVRQGFTIQGSTGGSKESMRGAITAIHCGADYSKVCYKQAAAVTSSVVTCNCQYYRDGSMPSECFPLPPGVPWHILREAVNATLAGYLAFWVLRFLHCMVQASLQPDCILWRCTAHSPVWLADWLCRHCDRP